MKIYLPVKLSVPTHHGNHVELKEHEPFELKEIKEPDAPVKFWIRKAGRESVPIREYEGNLIAPLSLRDLLLKDAKESGPRDSYELIQYLRGVSDKITVKQVKDMQDIVDLHCLVSGTPYGSIGEPYYCLRQTAPGSPKNFVEVAVDYRAGDYIPDIEYFNAFERDKAIKKAHDIAAQKGWSADQVIAKTDIDVADPASVALPSSFKHVNFELGYTPDSGQKGWFWAYNEAPPELKKLVKSGVVDDFVFLIPEEFAKRNLDHVNNFRDYFSDEYFEEKIKVNGETMIVIITQLD